MRPGPASTGGGGRATDRGTASILVLTVGLVLLGAGLVAASVAAAVVARHQAQTAADLGALAGAARVVHGPAVACARAAELVAANQGRLTGCVVSGLTVTVTVEVTPPAGAVLPRPAVATARAGPLVAPG